ncbi:MAG: DUF5682 family protein [Gemmataceae bacterium]
MQPFDFTPLADRSARIVFFPVRHHSPAGSRLLGTLAAALRPSAILVEGPADFNDRLNELSLAHQPPVALYSYVRLADGRRRGAFYPFCEHSPEWQAIQIARQTQAALRFIDLPWADIAALDAAEPENRFSDAAFRRSAYVDGLCRKLGLDDFHALWDTLFEIDPTLDVASYLLRAHALCGHMRLLEGAGSTVDRNREAFMAGQIREMEARGAGPILVVIGGAHCLPVWARLHGRGLGTMTEPAVVEAAPAEPGEERGLALTPYSFERLDSLTGYEAGMPNPGFYQQVWEAAGAGGDEISRRVLAAISVRLREQKQTISTADLIAVETTAVGLASLRGHARVWRTDLVDALTTSLIKEDVSRSGRHPLLEAIHAVLRGGARGVLAIGTLLPPLVRDVREQLERHALQHQATPREVELALGNDLDRQRSQVLHRLCQLGIRGFHPGEVREADPDEAMRATHENWRIAWEPDFEASTIEAARYGPTLAEAALAVLTERASGLERDAAGAVQLLLDAVLAGLLELAWVLRARVEELIRAEGDFFCLVPALGQLLYLFRYDHLFGTAGSAPVGALLGEAYARALWLLEGLGQVPGREAEAIQGVVSLRETFERCEAVLHLDRVELTALLARIAQDSAQSPGMRGAALGAGWSLGATDDNQVGGQFRQFVQPEQLGDFLGGLFALAREQVQRRPELILALHGCVAEWSAEEFLRAAPALRRAFTYFTPREKQRFAQTLHQLLGVGEEDATPPVDAALAARVLRFEARLFDLAAQCGLRRGDKE